MRTIQIGILGLGNVGSGAFQILHERAASISARVGAHVRVRKILVRDPQRSREVPFDPGLLTVNAEEILADPEIDVVVELIGGLEPARAYVLSAIERGKHVVTANKALLAAHGDEIFEAAAHRHVTVYFEGSVAGGIPIVRALREGLASDQIQSLVGIINGTSNFILDAMARNGVSYESALADAQAKGFAEADPTLDVSGGDAAHKLALLSLVSFGVRVDADKIPTEGIDTISLHDIRVSHELGFVIKSLAIAEMGEDGRPSLRVHPTMVPRDHILAGVHGSYNAVQVYSKGLGSSLYYGPGAGMLPTGVAVVSDIIEVCRDLAASSDADFSGEHASSRGVKPVELAPPGSVECPNYLCFHVDNRTGILGEVASCLGRHKVSIKAMTQDTPDGGVHMNMRIITDRVHDANIQAALAEFKAGPEPIAPITRIRILDEDRHGA